MLNRFLKLAPGLAVGLLCVLSNPAAQADGQGRPIRMPANPVISPDGQHIAFAWLGEIWTAEIGGGSARRLTNSDATDGQPLFSPDGERIAFVSTRTGSPQIFVMNADGTSPQQLTFHSAGYSLADWFPDGESILALGSRDHFHRDSTRLIKVSATERSAEKILADAMVEDAKLSPDGTQVLFTREGERWWRKGYEGERSAQVWLLELESGEFRELVHEGVECMWPIWMPDGKGFYFTKGALHGFELWKYRFVKNKSKAGKQSKVFGFEDDSIVYPSISHDGKTILFRHLFDLYSLTTEGEKRPSKIELRVAGDVDLPQDEMRREFSSADEVAFTDDGLEIAFVAGGDVWVTDTKLREPKRVTTTAGYEENVTFSTDGTELWFTSVTDGQVDIWKVTRQDADSYWWQNSEFNLEQVTRDMHVESDLRFTPDGKQLVFQQGRGDLVVLDIESNQKRVLLTGFSGIDYDVSADGQWLTYAQQDNDFNGEVWITALDGSTKPVNVSRHPDNDGNPRFSPDGKILAFTGRRVDSEVDVYYVYLNEEDDDETSRQRRMEEALELMKKKRKSGAPAKSDATSASKKADSKEDADSKEQSSEDGKDEDTKGGDKDKPQASSMEIDFAKIHERVRRVSIPNSYEGGLLFSPDGKKLAFAASIADKRGWYTIEFPDDLQPKFLTASTGSGAVWSKEAGGILYSQGGVPAKLDANGKLERYTFEVAQVSSRSGWLQAGFDRAWLAMREVWYDDRFANHNWDEVRRKYSPIAAEMHDTSGMGQVVELMLGELNGSHLGFSTSGSSRGARVEGWEDETAHLGVRFVEDFRGPGLLVRDVIKNGPADQEQSRMFAEDIILSIDGQAVDPAMDLTQVLNGRLDRDIHLRVLRAAKAAAGNSDEADGDADEVPQDDELDVTIRPTSYARARSLLYGQWLDHNREQVAELSEGKLGYLHIRAMDMGSFYDFERELYNVGYGKEGLVIDVRDNGGGSTTDLLLTALTQPRHAITVPRGGGQGYPHDRAIFASWSKPIIVLCNQNSYSNAEIFSHAIKTLGRGKVVGVRTAGGVVSTGSATINDVGRIRIPFRGWFLLNDGEDMERNGCEPHVVLWPMPGELPSGKDRQLEKAVEMLVEEVGEGSADKKLRYAAERDLDDK